MCDSDTLKAWNGMTFASGKYGWLNIGNGAKLWVDTSYPDKVAVQILNPDGSSAYESDFLKPDPQITMTLTLPEPVASWLRDEVGRMPFGDKVDTAYQELKRAINNGKISGR